MIKPFGIATGGAARARRRTWVMRVVPTCVKGNAGSNTADDHITAGRLALAQIPARLHKQALIRIDSGGGTHAFLAWVSSRRLKYSIGFNLTEEICLAILALPEHPARTLTSTNNPDDTERGNTRTRGTPPTQRDSWANTLTPA